MFSKFRFPLVFTFVLLVLVTTTAAAATIVVDGTDDPWPGGALLSSDGADLQASRGGLDLNTVYFTNNSTTLFWRFDTVNSSVWCSFTPPGCLQQIEVALDVDGNTTNGSSACGATTASFLADYVIVVTDTGGSVLDGNNSCADTGATVTVGYTGSGSALTEMSVAASAVGLANCGGGNPVCNVNYVIRTINGFGPTAMDYIPGSGQGNVAGSASTTVPQSPTAVSLQQVQAQAGITLMSGLVILLALLGTVLLFWRQKAVR
jgi:F0F1-type ATP synthase membrane subunit c/vacuolar-type H+-ATPase subunit K